LRLDLLPDKLYFNSLKTSYINRMQPNFPGTKIGIALQQVFSKRNMAMPTALFVLTDGEVSLMKRYTGTSSNCGLEVVRDTGATNSGKRNGT
jgi:hypothetical protein